MNADANLFFISEDSDVRSAAAVGKYILSEKTRAS